MVVSRHSDPLQSPVPLMFSVLTAPRDIYGFCIQTEQNLFTSFQSPVTRSKYFDLTVHFFSLVISISLEVYSSTLLSFI